MHNTTGLGLGLSAFGALIFMCIWVVVVGWALVILFWIAVVVIGLLVLFTVLGHFAGRLAAWLERKHS